MVLQVSLQPAGTLGAFESSPSFLEIKLSSPFGLEGGGPFSRQAKNLREMQTNVACWVLQAPQEPARPSCYEVRYERYARYERYERYERYAVTNYGNDLGTSSFLVGSEPDRTTGKERLPSRL